MIPFYTVEQAKKTILRRSISWDHHPEAEARVREILADVRQRGDAAIFDYTARFDNVTLTNLRVDKAAIDASVSQISAELYRALTISAERITRFHQLQPLPHWTTHELGGTIGQRVTPLDRVGIYVPGGTAPLPSSLLMGAIPAHVAGVREIVVVTPPDKNGRVPDVILAAAHIVGISELYTIGGAQAMAALAFGTESVPRVDKIAGPGNLYVTLAKRQLYGVVGIDGVYGPTETVVVADESANPRWIAADLLAQAEHDRLATAILFTPSKRLALAVQVEIGRQIEQRQRASIIEEALFNQSGIVLTHDLGEACSLANDFAAEHCCVVTQNAITDAHAIQHAGGLFIGERSFEVLGDYVAGPSHAMPTGGTARFASPLNVLDFVKISSIIALDDITSAELSPIAQTIALAEELDGHAFSAELRQD